MYLYLTLNPIKSIEGTTPARDEKRAADYESRCYASETN